MLRFIIGLLLLPTALIAEEKQMDIFVPWDELVHVQSLEEANRTNPDISQWAGYFAQPGSQFDCSFPCHPGMLEVVIFRDLEMGTFSVQFATNKAMDRYIKFNFDGDTKTEAIAIASWTLMDADAPDYVEPVGSLLVQHVIPALWDAGFDNPVDRVNTVAGEHELGFILVCYALPITSPDLDLGYVCDP